MSAIASARAIAFDGSAPASATTVTAIIGASDESGPSTRMREGPKTAYARSGARVAYRPLMAGSPDASAYPIPTGTRNAARTSPASASRPNQARRYERIVDSPGSKREPPVTPPARCRPVEATPPPAHGG